MAKTIKFNLICDGSPVRTIEDLREHFCIEDVLSYYDNGLLKRWLEVRGYQEELKELKNIKNDNSTKKAIGLIKVFHITDNVQAIKQGVYIFEYLKKRQNDYKAFEERRYRVDNIIEKYNSTYEKLINDIVNNPNDAAIIKAAICEIVNNYEWVFHIDHRNLFYYFMEKSPLAVMCLLMNPKSRRYYLPVTITDSDGTKKLDTESKPDKLKMYQYLLRFVDTVDFQNRLGSNLRSFSGVTDGYWKDLEEKGKLYMIVSMERGDYVRSNGKINGDLSYDDVKDKFLIIDGVDYKSNNASRQIKYMEV